MSENGMKVFDWDDLIPDDGGSESLESVLLPEGNYTFTVVKVEKAYYDGSDKIPACPMAKLFLRVDGGDLGTSLCVENVYLYEKMAWKAAQFLRCIGLRKSGEDINWRKLIDSEGQSGRCQIYVDSFTGRDGEKKQSNKVRRYFDPEERAPKKTFERGKF